MTGGGGFGSYFASRGARVHSNVFSYQKLKFSDDLFDNVTKIISSGREQNLEKIVLVVPRNLHKSDLNIRHLMVYEQVVIDATETDDSFEYSIFYPDAMWMEAAYWKAKQWTSLHPLHLSEDELENVRLACSLSERTPEQLRSIEKALK